MTPCGWYAVKQNKNNYYNGRLLSELPTFNDDDDDTIPFVGDRKLVYFKEDISYQEE